jgi:hypothetical protein
MFLIELDDLKGHNDEENRFMARRGKVACHYFFSHLLDDPRYGHIVDAGLYV